MKKINPNANSNKDQVLAERDTRRLAKQKILDKNRNIPEATNNTILSSKLNQSVSSHDQQPKYDADNGGNTEDAEKSREQILVEREQKRLAKLAKKQKGKIPESAPPTVAAAAFVRPESSANEQVLSVANKLDDLSIKPQEKSITTKAERRAKQEAQRAAKAKMLEEKAAATASSASSTTAATAAAAAVPKSTNKSDGDSVKTSGFKIKKPPMTATKLSPHRVKLFNHLYIENQTNELKPNSTNLHPAIVKLGTQYANRIIVGSNARCLSFMSAIKMVIQDYKTPPQKEFQRGLEETIQLASGYLHQCRPLAVSVSNAIKFIKWQITQLPTDTTDIQLKERLLESVDTYVRDQVEKAAQAISISVQEKISNGDVLLTFGCSSLITHILEEAKSRGVDFRVIVVNARPDNEGIVMLERLVYTGIECSMVMINAIGFIMPEVTKVLLGAHALLANGYVMARIGTSQVALIAKTYNVPVLVCCETHKFSERVQTDAFVCNELGNPSDVVSTSKSNSLSNWEALVHLTPLNLKYDITPPELVTAVVTEVAILPCTSVPVILRIKPSEIGY